MDQCTHCTVRGDLQACRQTKCFQHENWYAIEQQKAIDELMLAITLCMEEDASEYGISVETILLCHEATSKHDSTTKEQ